MIELNKILILLIPFAIYLISFWGKKYLFLKKGAGKVMAVIDKIHLHKIDDIWSPEVQIDYLFYLKDKKYIGTDFIRMDCFLKKSYFLLANQRDFPVLSSVEGQYLGEEHIEHYLLQKRNKVVIEYHQRSPAENRIYRREGEKEIGFFQNTKTDFPWVS